MPFEIVRNDITNMHVDAIVNTANPKPIVGAGTDSMVHQKAGPGLLAARQKIGNIPHGGVALTPAFDLDAKHVIHVVGPVWLDGKHCEEALLRGCYDKALRLALKYGCKSIAFPLISTGNYGFPKDKALQIAISAFSTFLLEHEMQIYLVVFDRTSFKLSEKLFQGVADYIDENFVDACELAAEVYNRRMLHRREMAIYESEALCAPCADKEYLQEAAVTQKRPTKKKADSLDTKLKQLDAGFSETLLNLIDKTGKKDSEIYKRANVSKQHFSKIRNNPQYQPTKATAIAFALALELDVDQTNDLIGRAGYTLTKSSRFDLIIQYYIEQKRFNIVEINIALHEFDQTLLSM